MAIFYKPFSIDAGQVSGALPLDASSGGESLVVDIDLPNAAPTNGEPADAYPPEEVILERDGIYYINSRFMNPGEETEKNLDQKFFDLIDSVINPESPPAL
jgi:hypothetical protein